MTGKVWTQYAVALLAQSWLTDNANLIAEPEDIDGHRLCSARFVEDTGCGTVVDLTLKGPFTPSDYAGVLLSDYTLIFSLNAPKNFAVFPRNWWHTVTEFGTYPGLIQNK